MIFDALDPFLTTAPEHPDFDHADEYREAVKMVDRHDLLLDVLDGHADMDDFLECLYDQGIDPIAWMRCTAENLGLVMDGGRAYVSNESGILLPA